MIKLNGGTRSSSRSRVANRLAWLANAGIENSAMSVSRSAGSALCCSLATRIPSCTAASRAAGSAKCVGSEVMTAETRLPWVPFCSSVRMDTGTDATSGRSGRASCFCSQVRNAPAHSAITTSLTVTPAAFLIALTSASGTLVKAQRRCGPMFLLNGVAGATNGGADSTTPRFRRNRNRSMSGSQGRAGLLMIAGSDRTISTETRAARTGLVASDAALRASNCAAPGSASGRHRSGSSISRGSGEMSISAASKSFPETPSMAAWCTLM